MKYKYIVGLLVALGFSNTFAAEEEITAKDYQQIYLAFRCGGAAEINAALQNNQHFNHKDDTNIIRSSQTGLALRMAVIGLDAADLQAVVEKNPEFFKTSLGTSLIYGWTLNQFKEPITPYYIGYYFSFDKLFQGLASKMDDSQVSTFLRSAFTLSLSAVEADRWAFYDHMLYLPYAIEQVGKTGTSDLSIDDVIRMSHRTKEEAKAEAKAAQSLPTIIIDDTHDDGIDELADILSDAKYLSTSPADYEDESYYSSIKDAFSSDSVSVEDFIKLQFLTSKITMGLGAEIAYLRSIDAQTKNIIRLDQNVATSSRKGWFEGNRNETTIRNMCDSVLEAIAQDMEDERQTAADAAAEAEAEAEAKEQSKEDVERALRPLFVRPTKDGDKWALRIPKRLTNVSTLKRIVASHTGLTISAADRKALEKFDEGVQVNSNTLKTLTKEGEVLKRILCALAPLVINADDKE